MVKTTKQAAQAFNGANGVNTPISVAAMAAFIKTNGLGNVGLQLAPAALANGTLFGQRPWQCGLAISTSRISQRHIVWWRCYVACHATQQGWRC